MKIKPLNGHVLVELEKNEKTKSGIILATQNSDVRMERAEVLEVDSDVAIVKRGDNVYLKLYSLSSVEYDGKEYHFIKYSDILGIEK